MLCLHFSLLLSVLTLYRFDTVRAQIAILTILAVVGDLHLPLLRAQQGLGYLGYSMARGKLAVEEVTRARLLHDVRPREARHLAERIVAKDDGAVLHTCVCYHKLLICGWRETDGKDEHGRAKGWARWNHPSLKTLWLIFQPRDLGRWLTFTELVHGKYRSFRGLELQVLRYSPV